jgi:hypothetical protein
LDALATPSDGSAFLSVTRTKEEISIVSDHEIIVEGGRKQDGKLWRCFQLQGPMDLGTPIPEYRAELYHLTIATFHISARSNALIQITSIA